MSIGKKWTMISLAIPFIIGWIVIIVANSPGLFYLGRLLTGFSGHTIRLTQIQYCSHRSFLRKHLFIPRKNKHKSMLFCKQLSFITNVFLIIVHSFAFHACFAETLVQKQNKNGKTFVWHAIWTCLVSIIVLYTYICYKLYVKVSTFIGIKNLIIC